VWNKHIQKTYTISTINHYTNNQLNQTMKAHIIIVEDEAILYERLRRNLVQENYSVDKYTPSVEDAIGNINSKRPDLVLLDIDLQGEETGLDLGKKLYETYKIPFVYVTRYADDETFYKGLHTHHEDFIIKTKPHLDSKELLRKIQTILQRNGSKVPDINKQGVMGLVKYLDEIKTESGNMEITRVPVPYNEIAFFSTDHFDKLEKVKPNYIWFRTVSGNKYLLKISLTELLKKTPYHFCRISDKYIVNLSPGIFNGRINGSRLSILGQDLVVSTTYKDEVLKRMEHLYQG